MPGTGVCPPASVGWLGGKNCRRALMTCQLGRTEVWLALAASGEDASASDQGASGQAGGPAWMLREKHGLGVRACR